MNSRPIGARSLPFHVDRGANSRPVAVISRQIGVVGVVGVVGAPPLRVSCSYNPAVVLHESPNPPHEVWRCSRCQMRKRRLQRSAGPCRMPIRLLEWRAILAGRAADEPPKPGGGLFHATPRRNPAARVLVVPGSGMTKPIKRTFKAPAHLTQHRAAARRRRSAPPHDDPSATGRAPRHGGGIRPPGGRHVPSAHIRARLAPVLYRSSFVVVVVSGQWCTHCDTRKNRRLVAIKTAFAR